MELLFARLLNCRIGLGELVLEGFSCNGVTQIRRVVFQPLGVIDKPRVPYLISIDTLSVVTHRAVRRGATAGDITPVLTPRIDP